MTMCVQNQNRILVLKLIFEDAYLIGMKSLKCSSVTTYLKVSCLIVAIFGILSPDFVWGQDFENAKQTNWHQWRGPNADGTATVGNPPTKWGADTNIKWKIEIPGEGSSTPIVWNDQVFVLSAIETDRKPENVPELHPEARTQPPQNIVEFVVWSIDRRTGDVKWKQKVAEAAPHEGRHPSTTYAAASPMTDGKHLYVSFGSYGVFCLTLDGEVVWEKDLGDMRTRRGWGEAVSPVIHGDKLVVNWDQEDQSQIFVLNASDGEEVWSKRRNEPTTWATPLIVNAFGHDQLITNGTTCRSQLRSSRRKYHLGISGHDIERDSLPRPF